MYRIFLLRQSKITAHHEFRAENDDGACQAAAIAFDACTDHCDDFELWKGAQLVASSTGLTTRAIIAKADEAFAGAMTATSDGAIERIAVRIIEAAMAANGALRDSPRLNVRLNALRPSPAGPQ
jgi:hypothetical protein